MMPLLLLVCTLPVDKRVCLGHLKVKRFVCMYQPGLTKMDFLLTASIHSQAKTSPGLKN